MIRARCAAYHVPYPDVMGRSTARRVSSVRALCWKALRDDKIEGRPTWTLEEIASWFGVRHSAVQQAVAKLEARRLTG
jgi:hypothetical protein